jgi:alpha-L-arabinofuranosidase
MLLEDIRLYFDDWVTWYDFEQTESDFARRRTALKALIEETEAYLERYKK